MCLTPNQEKVVEFIINEYQKSSNGKITLSSTSNDLSMINKQELLKIVHFLANNNYIKMEMDCIHEDFPHYVIFEPLSKCLNYFEQKRINKIMTKRTKIKIYIPIIISIISLIWAILSQVQKN